MDTQRKSVPVGSLLRAKHFLAFEELPREEQEDLESQGLTVQNIPTSESSCKHRAPLELPLKHLQKEGRCLTLPVLGQTLLELDPLISIFIENRIRKNGLKSFQFREYFDSVGAGSSVL